MSTMLSLNVTIPTTNNPGTPVVVVYDNGDWEIAFAGDVDYIQEGDSYHSHHLISEVFVLVMLYFDMGDEDDLDISDDVIYFTVSEETVAGADNEPVLVIFHDGEIDITERRDALAMAENDLVVTSVQNFIPLLDVFEDLSKFCQQHAEMMFGVGLDIDDDDDDADGEDQ